LTLRVCVDGLAFDFPPGWRASKYDDWAFYRKQFGKMRSGIKAVDIVAIAPEQVLWLIEVKDYRRPRQSKVPSLPGIVAAKVFDTLAGLLPAAVNANDDAERALASAALGAGRLRVVAHVEQTSKPSKLFPQAVDLSRVQMVLRRLVKAIDPHALVVDRGEPARVPWTVS
jgi:hypothetical protein